MKYSSLFPQLSLCLKNRDNSLCSSNLQKIRVGFTLVELIVVITILAILALVAFLMMSDATVSARDSNRLASIKNIYDASQLQAVQQRLLPLPDQAITLTVSGTDIGWQGYMSGYVAQAYGYSDSVYDPRDNTPYIYRVNQARNKSQYLAYLENGGEVTQGDILLALGGMDGIERIGGVKESKSFAGLGGLEGFGIDTAQATDFSKRVPYVYGDRLGVVLSNTTNEGANVALGSGGTLDLGGNTIDSNYSVYVNEGLKLASVEGTGAVALKTNGGLDQVIANATIVASSGSNSGSGSSACGLTQGEVDAMNIPFEARNGHTMTTEEWCALTSLDLWGEPVNSTALGGITKLSQLTSLLLIGSSIDVLPENFGNLTNLQYLNLEGNSITHLPESIGNFSNLTHLDLGCLPLEKLPDSLGNLQNLVFLRIECDGNNTQLDSNLIGLFGATSLGGSYYDNYTMNGFGLLPTGIYSGENSTPLGQEVHIIISEQHPDAIQIIVGPIPPPSCGLTQEEVDSLNAIESIPGWGEVSGNPRSGQEWCDTTSLQWGGKGISTLPMALQKIPGLLAIDLSSNQFMSIPSWIDTFSGVVNLHLASNQLSSLPSSIGNLTNLTSLNISSNLFSSFPNELTSLSQLENLYLHYNSLNGNIPSSIGNLTNLSTLDLYGNNITGLPDEIGNLSNLNYLRMSDNQITGLPETMSGMTSMLLIEANNNSIGNIPVDIGNLTNLQTIELTNNQITSIPSSIGNLSSLYMLKLTNNQITSLPTEIGGLTQLHELHLRDNQIPTIPESIGNLSNISFIDFANNSLTMLPDSIGNLNNIEQLDFQGTNLGNLAQFYESYSSNSTITQMNITTSGDDIRIITHDDNYVEIIVGPIPLPNPGSCGITGAEILELNNYGFRDIGVEGPGDILNLLGEGWCNLTVLDISGYNLTTIPTGILKLGNLEALDISNNNFLSFPSEILVLTNLTSLTAYSNGFTSIPANISDLTQLTYLNIGNNALISLPDNIGSLSQLEILFIGGNQLMELPLTLGNLSNLQELFADNNLLTSLPSSIGNMSSLYQLYVPNNEIESLPTSIGDLSNLTYLSIQNNQIDAIPSTIDGCISLVLLRADNNLLAGLPAEIGNLSSLYILNLANNQLQTLPNNFSGLDGQLVELTLAGNSGLGNLNRNFSDVASGMQVGTFTQSNITPTGGTITFNLPDVNHHINITVTP